MVVHTDAAFGYKLSNGGRIIGAVDAIVGFGQAHPQHSKRAARVSLFVYNGISPSGSRCQHFAHSNRVYF